MASILFDESHQELLRSQIAAEDTSSDTWDSLRAALEALGWQVGVHSNEGEALTDDLLAGHDVLVLAAPGLPLLPSEIKSIANFLGQGHALLIANSTESLWRQNSNSVNILLEPFALRFERSLYRPANQVTSIYPHFVTSGVTRLQVSEPTYLHKLDDRPNVLAVLPWPEHPFLAAVDAPFGRVVAMGDSALLGDRLISEADNKTLVLNTFAWLSSAHILDLREPRMSDRVLLGQSAEFSVVLANPRVERLQRIRCLLESDAGAHIQDSSLRIRSIPPGGQLWLQWTIEPQQLGQQSLGLTIDFPRGVQHESLFFDPVATFECLPDARTDLVIADEDDRETETVVTNTAFTVRARVEWRSGAQETDLTWELDFPNAHLRLDRADVALGRWHLVGLDPGDWRITLACKETGHSIERLVRVRPSKWLQIDRIEQDTVAPLSARIHLLLLRLRADLFDVEAMRQILFRLLTPEEYVREIYPVDAAERLIAGLTAAREERGVSESVLQDLIRYIAPVFSPVQGCCIPYDPDLATHLVRTYERYEDNLASNFLYLEGKDPLWIEQSIASYLLHEKYGHGFFYTQTVLGRQLGILYRYGLLRQEDRDRLPAPYPRLLAQEFSVPIRALKDSAIVVNEGFASWMELSILHELGGAVGQAAYRRKDFLMNRDEELARIQRHSAYLKRYPSFEKSRYREGYNYFSLIEGYFGSDYGRKCAVQAMLKACDVDVGVAENLGHVVFGLSSEVLTKAILEDPADDARSDMRLRRIHEVLRNQRERVRTEQRDLQCQRVCLHVDCPVNRVINEQLGW